MMGAPAAPALGARPTTRYILIGCGALLLLSCLCGVIWSVLNMWVAPST
jgi:hypothetical protein